MKIYNGEFDLIKNKVLRPTMDYVWMYLERNGVSLGNISNIFYDLLDFYNYDAYEILKSYSILKDIDQIGSSPKYLTDFDIYYSDICGIPIVKETIINRGDLLYNYYTYNNNRLCKFNYEILDCDKNYNDLYRDGDKFWDISNLPKYDFVALYIKSKMAPYQADITPITNYDYIKSICDETQVLKLYNTEIIKLKVFDENYIDLLIRAKKDKTFRLKYGEFPKEAI